jgi:DNA repair and recombination protein RAD52
LLELPAKTQPIRIKHQPIHNYNSSETFKTKQNKIMSDTEQAQNGDHQFDSAVFGVGFGHVQYSIEERQFLQKELEQKLSQDMISKRQGPGGGKVHYIETWKAIEQTNRLFGFNGWSSRIMEINLDFIDQIDGRFTAGVSAIVRITLKDGSFREDIGYGISENQKQKGKALEQGKKKAVSDAMKRALKSFGHALGLSVYDKDYLKDVEKLVKLKALKGDIQKEEKRAINPHFNQAPGSPPRNTFVPSVSPPKMDSFINTKVIKTGIQIKSEPDSYPNNELPSSFQPQRLPQQQQRMAQNQATNIPKAGTSPTPAIPKFGTSPQTNTPRAGLNSSQQQQLSNNAMLKKRLDSESPALNGKQFKPTAVGQDQQIPVYSKPTFVNSNNINQQHPQGNGAQQLAANTQHGFKRVNPNIPPIAAKRTRIE